jgi:hypothetical protein
MANFFAYDENRGTVGWSGVFRRTGTVDTNPAVLGSVSCTSGGKWVSQKVELIINRAYLSGYTSSERQGVAAHEFGHSFGLAHNNATNSGCPTLAGHSKALYLMYWHDDRFTSTCATLYAPRFDDVDGVNALY